MRKTNLQNTREGKKETKIHRHRTLGIGHWASGIGHWALGIGHLTILFINEFRVLFFGHFL